MYAIRHYKRQLFLILLLILLPFFLSAKNIEFSFPNKNHISIKINNLSKILSYENNNLILKNEYSQKIFSSNISYDIIKIPLAIPIKNQSNLKILKIKKIDNVSNINFNNLYDLFKIKYVSKMRDIPISVLEFNPFLIENGQLKIVDQAEINIFFSEELEAFRLDSSFYSNLINYYQIVFKHNLPSNDKIEYPQIDDWYNPDLHYIKFTTTKTGIAKVNALDILNLKPEFKNLPLNYFHLSYKGNEVPIRIVSSDSVFDEIDEIFFLSKIVSGDSTWFNNYTDSAVYFFTYDTTKLGLRLGNYQEYELFDQKLNSFFINVHLEEEKQYFWGDFDLQWDVENIYREKWLWDDVDANDKDEFKTYFIAYPNDSINLKINLQSMYFNKEILKQHDFFIILNKDTIDFNSVDTGSIKEISYNLSESKIIPGINELIIKLIPKYFNGDLVIPNKIGIDFIELSYNSKSDISYFDTKYNIPSLPSNNLYYTSITGFKDKNVYILDNHNKSFLNKKASKILKISGAVNKDFISLTLNGNAEFLNGRYFIVINYDSLLKKYKFQNYNEGYNFLRNFNKNSKFIIICNLQTIIPKELKDLLNDFGAVAVNDYGPNSNWYFINKTNLAKAVEILKDNEIIKFDNILSDDYISNEMYYDIILAIDTNFNSSFYFADDSNLVSVNLSYVNFSNLRSFNNQADVLFITHQKFIDKAKRLVDYRKKQGFEVKIINVDDIYKEFNYGIKEPKAIKKFLKYAFQNWQKPAPKYVLLIGDANWDSRYKFSESINIDYIPTYGWPVSDYWYSQLDDSPDDIHDLYIGRLPVASNEQLDAIINKLIEYDSIPTNPWMKRFLSLTGGQNQFEIETFYENMFSLLYDYWFLKNFSGDTIFIFKQLGEREKEATRIISEINRGAIWVNFLGHGSPQVFDMDGWHAEKLNNKGKYPFFTTISCNTAAFAEPNSISRDEEYVLVKDKGFIGAGGSTNLGLITPGLLILGDMLNIMLNSQHKSRQLGDILNNAKIRLMLSDPLSRAFAKQYVLIGDPLTKIRIPENYYLYILEKDVKILNNKNSSLINESDSLVYISGILYNNGFCYENSVNLKLIHQYNQNFDTLINSLESICFKEKFNFEPISVFRKVGKHFITIQIETLDTSFIAYKSDFDVFEDGLLPVDPLPFWSVNPENLVIRMINPTERPNIDYEFKITSIINGYDSLIYSSKFDEIIVSPTHIDWKVNYKLQNEKTYYLHSRIINKQTLQSSRWFTIPFFVTNDSTNQVIINLLDDNFNNLDLINCAVDRNGLIQYKSKYLPIRIKSSQGKKDTIRLAEIEFNDTLYIVTPSESNAPVGINLITISSETQKVKEVKYYYTWGDENSTRNLVKFLNDSVSDGDWLALASCGSAWRQFYYTGLNDSTKEGSFYTFKLALSQYGAEKIWNLPDSIDNPHVSYCFIGRKNRLGKNIELMSLDGSYIFINDSIEFYPNSAKIELPELFGFDSLLKFEIQGIDLQHNSVFLTIYDLKDNSKIETYQFNDSIIFLSNSLLHKSEKISGIINFQRINEVQKLNLKAIKIYIIPSAELCIDKANSLLNNFKVIRGDTVGAYFKIDNLSLRNSAYRFLNLISVKLLSGNIIQDSNTVNELLYNKSLIDTLILSTLFFDEINHILININSNDNLKEIYKFNNNTNYVVEVLRDSIKPSIEIFSDNILISDSSFISINPKFKFLLFDNSYEPIQVEAIKVRFNGYSLKEENTKYYRYQNLNQGNLKSQLEIQLDSIFDYDNLIEVYFLDAAGNRDTIEYHLFTTINSFIYDEFSYPNPFNEKAIISFKYKSPDNQGMINIKIFDLNGKIVRTLTNNLIIGENKIEFDGRDEFGNKLPYGVYFYYIQIIGPNYTLPKSGKILKH